jgi:hypothetical protein
MSELYLGRSVDPTTLAETGDVVPFDPDRLTRHAVCFGMTGSGKTGLCVTLLEELAIAGVPVLVIDPKGDMTNLALAFADHAPADFEPWVDPAEADREGLSVAQMAEKLATRWKRGLTEHGVDQARIDRFVEGTDVTVYTPGSSAGVSIDVLAMLRAPQGDLAADPEGTADLVAGTVSSLLGLVGHDADPVKDPSHILISRIVADAWTADQDLDLEGVILKLVDPPFQKVGVFPVDTFYPRKDRMALAMELNGVAASPSFAAWSQGVSLDVDRLLDRSGKTPLHIFSLAHLGASERMFFASMLLNQVVAWSRRQPGSSALRALVYFDEVFGFLPPYPKNPPTKGPVLTLMKQARAVGVGTMLVTQNPVDIDYNAMSNAGLWLMGRLQTSQDRDRVLDGLAGATGAIDRKTLSGWLEALPSRTFLVKDVKESQPFLMKSRWAISYLRGPLTRREIGQLDQPVPEAPSAGSASSSPAPTAPPAVDDGTRPEPPAPPDERPVQFLDPAVAFSARLAPFLEEAEEPRRDDGAVVWRAAVLATLHLRFDEGREYVLEREETRLFFPITDDHVGASVEPPFEPADFLPSAPANGRFHALPAMIDEARELKALEKRVIEEVYRGETEKMFRQRFLKLDSRAGETRDAFEARVREALQDRIDEKVLKLKDRVDRQVDRLEAKQKKLERDIEARQGDVSASQMGEAMNLAETALAWFTGRSRSMSRAVSKRNQSRRASERLARAEADLTDVQREMYDIESALETDVLAIQNEELARLDDIEEVAVDLERADLRLDRFGILWVPVTRPTLG